MKKGGNTSILLSSFWGGSFFYFLANNRRKKEKDMKQKKRDTLYIGLALFASYFGAGNLIFPGALGLVSGNEWSLSLIHI